MVVEVYPLMHDCGSTNLSVSRSRAVVHSSSIRDEEEHDEETEGSGEARFAGDETPSVQIRRGKLRSARDPRILYAARSYATAASSAVSKVPSQTLAPFFAGSLISAANFPHGRCLTPR
ncbi:hypothetical protein IEQ34_014411 [Dendrobium chrysotoxum]|uniref:Uncharacterized protein n=1 Tax=Dendrobium chrysotoxum TaxID=161865 RepID=A0AAV7GLE7_DENCH|nr:hypothetical protein IEQ34_014411 [Dendrobium chrysotoxum]